MSRVSLTGRHLFECRIFAGADGIWLSEYRNTSQGVDVAILENEALALACSLNGDVDHDPGQIAYSGRS
jgi:hypothetical protein